MAFRNSERNFYITHVLKKISAIQADVDRQAVRCIRFIG